MALKDYSTTPANNNAAPPNGAPEGMLAASVNDTMRQMMADVKGGVAFKVDSIAEMTALDTTELSDGNAVTVTGYRIQGDEGGGSFYWDSASTTTDDGGFYISSDLGGTGRWVRIIEYPTTVLMFGAKAEDQFDNLAFLDNATAACVTAGGIKLIIPKGAYEISDTWELPHNLIVEGEGAKKSIIKPHSTFPFGALKYIVVDELNTELPTPDNDFFCIRRNFGVRNTIAESQAGCYWARPGGGSEYSNMYLADAFGEDTLRVSGILPGEGGDGGASVGASFNNIWLANSGGAPTPSRAKNGLELISCYSMTFTNLIIDYQSNSTDYTIADTDGYGIKLDGSVGIVFNGINAEGNSKPYYATNSQGALFDGGAIYRTGIGSSASTDPDFAYTVESSQANMPTIINQFTGQGYDEANGGGMARIRSGATIVTRNRARYWSYVNENPITMHQPLIDDPEFSGTATGFKADAVTVEGFLNLGSKPIETIAAGVITVTKGFVSVAVESTPNPDNLDTITAGTTGDVLVLTPAVSTETVTVTESGNLKLAGGSFVMDHGSDTLVLLANGANWIELSRSNNG